MTRRSCVIPVVGVISALLLAIGIGLMVSQVFRTMMQNRLKKVKLQTDGQLCLKHLRAGARLRWPNLTALILQWGYYSTHVAPTRGNAAGFFFFFWVCVECKTPEWSSIKVKHAFKRAWWCFHFVSAHCLRGNRSDLLDLLSWESFSSGVFVCFF